MKITARKDIRTLRNLLLFAAYIAALWGLTWYNLHYYSGAYNTIVTDVLLTVAFALAFFSSIVIPGKRSKTLIVGLCLASLAAAALSFYALRPHYTVSDGLQILSAAHYEDVQLNESYGRTDIAHSGSPLVSTGIVYQATQDDQVYELLFNPATGDYYDVT